MITVADKPVALAGVMGGEATEISEKSTRVVLEAAVFNGKSIRKTKRSPLTFVLNHLLALKKGSMWQLSMKPMMRQRA